VEQFWPKSAPHLANDCAAMRSAWVRRRAAQLALCVLFATCQESADDESAPELAEGDDVWQRLTTEEWQPGRVGEFNSTNPIKDLECLGPQTTMVSDPSLPWAAVKDALLKNLGRPLEDPWLLSTITRIQKEEPDTCVLGITTTGAFLLPVTMPKFRNMARVLSSDQDFLVLNVTFFDSLRSGFPIFGVIDGLATLEYRAWFETPESYEYFPDRVDLPACREPAAVELREAVDALRHRRDMGRVPLQASVDFLASYGAARSCKLAAAAAFLISALARVEATAEVLGPEAPTRDAALRDVIELVSRAEEFVREFSREAQMPFGELVASPWNVWWLLHQLQLVVLPKFFGPHARRPGTTRWDA